MEFAKMRSWNCTRSKIVVTTVTISSSQHAKELTTTVLLQFEEVQRSYEVHSKTAENQIHRNILPVRATMNYIVSLNCAIVNVVPALKILQLNVLLLERSSVRWISFVGNNPTSWKITKRKM